MSLYGLRRCGGSSDRRRIVIEVDGVLYTIISQFTQSLAEFKSVLMKLVRRGIPDLRDILITTSHGSFNSAVDTQVYICT